MTTKNTKKVTLKDLVGKEKFEEIVDKEWNVAEFPSDEELAKEIKKSPKARNNANSRKNLIQYKERSEESKEASLKNIRIKKEKSKSTGPSRAGMSSNRKKLIEKFPITDVMDEDESELYYSILEMYVGDFDEDSLSGIDVDGILTLAINRVLEKRLLSKLHGSPSLLQEIMPSIEKLQKSNEKIKESLGSRRRDRIDPRANKDMSILDLVRVFDEDHKQKLLDRYNMEEDAIDRQKFRNKMDSIINNE